MAMTRDECFYGPREGPAYYASRPLLRHGREYYSDFDYGYKGAYGGYSQAPVVELMVPMCCTKCEEKVRENMLELHGAQRVMVDLEGQRVAVTGFVDPMKALKAAQKVKRDSQFWTGVPLYSSPSRGVRDFFKSPFKHHSVNSRRLYSGQLNLADSSYSTSRYEYGGAPLYRSSSYNRYMPSYNEQFYYGPEYSLPRYYDYW